MPEIHFKIQWPNGTQEICYSPSLIVKEYFIPGSDYPLDEFMERSRTALQIASDRVKAKYGAPCGMALRQLNRLETTAAQYGNQLNPIIRFIEFIE